MKTDPAAEIDSQELNSTVRDVASNCVRHCFKAVVEVHEQTNGLIQRTNLEWICWGDLFGQKIAVYLTVWKASNHFSRCISPFSQSAQPGRWLPPALLLRFCWEESQHCSLRGFEKNLFWVWKWSRSLKWTEVRNKVFGVRFQSLETAKNKVGL